MKARREMIENWNGRNELAVFPKNVMIHLNKLRVVLIANFEAGRRFSNTPKANSQGNDGTGVLKAQATSNRAIGSERVREGLVNIHVTGERCGTDPKK